jgi:enediyne biosynthesis protein E4
MLDTDGDGWIDLFVANDTQPNKLYRNQRNGTFKEVAVEAGVALNADGKARAGMGVDAGYLGSAAAPSLAVTNFDNEMIGLYRAIKPGLYEDAAMQLGVGAASRTTLGFGCLFVDCDLDGALDLVVANGHIDETVRNIRGHVGYAQPPHLFLNQGDDTFRDIVPATGGGFATPKVGRGLAFGDFDRDGDIDMLMTTNGGPAVLYRNDQRAGNRSIRFRLTGTRSNRDGIGAIVRIYHGDTSQTRMVKSGSSYLSQSELPVTFGVRKRDHIDRVVITWPSGRVEEFKALETGRAYDAVEGRGVTVQK